MRATMSLWGLWKITPDVLDDFVVPQTVDRATFLDNLLIECGELEILYTNPLFLRAAIKAWSAKMLPQWEKLDNTTRYDYDPISNYDRHEMWTDTGSSSSTGNATATSADNSANTGESVSYVKAFDNNELTNNGKATQTGNVNTQSTGEQKSTQSVSGDSSHNGHVYGNIGVTTTQQMIDAERNIDRYNVIDEIIADFRARFCLMVY